MGFFELFAGALAGLYAVVQSYGVAIILLTLAVRVLILPLSIKSTLQMRESQRNMARVQPEVNKIRQKYKGDRQKTNEEMMALYKREGVNPMQSAGGCGWLIVQIPVFIALYYAIRSPLSYLGYTQEGSNWTPNNGTGFLETLRQSSLAQDLLDNPLPVHRFLGIRLDCSVSDVWRGAATLPVPGNACSTGSPLLSVLPYIVLLALMAVTMYWQQRQMQAAQPANNPQAQQMQMMTKIMPVMFVFFGLSFPAGVLLYWVTTQAWTIVQQKILLQKAPPPETAAGNGSGKAGEATRGDKKAPTTKATKSGRDASGDGKAKATQARSKKAAAGSASKKKRKR